MELSIEKMLDRDNENLEFESKKYKIIKQAVSKELANFVSKEFELVKDLIYQMNSISDDDTSAIRDSQVEQCFSWYAPMCFETLMLHLKPLVEKITKKNLYPTYSYGRIYYNGAEMPSHLDRPSCEYSVTICLQKDSVDWPIWFKDAEGDIKPLSLDIGDMCVYKGTELDHWRLKYQGKKQIQAFLHYVDVTGPYANYKFDGRDSLALPEVKQKSK